MLNVTQIKADLATAAMPIDSLRAKLSAQNALIRYSAQFADDSIVTPRPDFGYANVGVPHLVVRTLRLERNRLGFGTASFGKQADLLVSTLASNGMTLTFWVESFAFERWSDAHDDAFRTNAAIAQTKLDELIAAEEAARTGDALDRLGHQVGTGSYAEDSVLLPRDLPPGERLVSSLDHEQAKCRDAAPSAWS